MRTEVTYNETPVNPGTPIVIEHPDDHQVVVFDGEHIGGGGENRWLMRWALIGPENSAIAARAAADK